MKVHVAPVGSHPGAVLRIGQVPAGRDVARERHLVPGPVPAVVHAGLRADGGQEAAPLGDGRPPDVPAEQGSERFRRPQELSQPGNVVLVTW